MSDTISPALRVCTDALNSHNRPVNKVLLLFRFTDEKERLRGAKELAQSHVAGKWPNQADSRLIAYSTLLSAHKATGTGKQREINNDG